MAHTGMFTPSPAGYDELANLYEKEATNLKTWDPAAVRFGPVFCCWWFYWNGANGADKGNHGGVDFLPWWLNQVKWLDQINGARTLDVFDIHAYADGGPTSEFHQRAASGGYGQGCAGFYWDPATRERRYEQHLDHQRGAQPRHSLHHSALQGHGQRHLSRHASVLYRVGRWACREREQRIRLLNGHRRCGHSRRLRARGSELCLALGRPVVQHSSKCRIRGLEDVHQLRRGAS